MDFYIFQDLYVKQNETRFYSCTQRTCKSGQVNIETLIKVSGIPFTILRNNKYIRLFNPDRRLARDYCGFGNRAKILWGISILLGFATRIISLS